MTFTSNAARLVQIGNTADFSGTFPKVKAKEWLEKYKSNIILIYQCSDADDELEIEQAIRLSENIPTMCYFPA